jgi:hypothetical protein
MTSRGFNSLAPMRAELIWMIFFLLLLNASGLYRDRLNLRPAYARESRTKPGSRTNHDRRFGVPGKYGARNLSLHNLVIEKGPGPVHLL